MKREQLEHVLRAASRIVDSAELLVIGSQSVLATWDERRLPIGVSCQHVSETSSDGRSVTANEER